jgi:hypothetical protein
LLTPILVLQVWHTIHWWSENLSTLSAFQTFHILICVLTVTLLSFNSLLTSSLCIIIERTTQWLEQWMGSDMVENTKLFTLDGQCKSTHCLSTNTSSSWTFLSKEYLISSHQSHFKVHTIFQKLTKNSHIFNSTLFYIHKKFRLIEFEIHTQNFHCIEWIMH